MARLGPVLLTVLLDLVGFAIVIPLMALYAEDYGATEQQAILLLGVYSLAQFFFAPLWGAWSDRVGRRPVMLISIAMTAVFLASYAFAPSLGWLFVFRFLHGVAAANLTVAQAYIADVTPPDKRAMGMGLFGASFGVGFTIGPLLGGELGGHFGLEVPMLVAAGLSAVNFVWAWFGLPESYPVGEKGQTRQLLGPARILQALRHPVVGAALLLTFVSTLAFSMMEVSFNLVAEHVWYPDLTRQAVAMKVGRYLGMLGVIGVIIQGGMIHPLVKRFGEPPLVIVGYLITAMGLFGLAWAKGGWEIWPVFMLLAVGTSLANPALRALVSKGVSADQQGSVLGVNQSLGALARATAPWIAMGLYGISRSTPFIVAGVIMLIALVFAGPATRRASVG